MTEVEKNLTYRFKNRKLLDEALHHSSIRRSAIPFERLEFLGDRVLGLIMAEHIYKTTNGSEGEMAKQQAFYVCAGTCCGIARQLGIGREITTAGAHLKDNETVLADAMEAIIGAIFIDAGYDRAREIVLSVWNAFCKRSDIIPEDPKTKLQEICQHESGELPTYKVLNVSGQAHAPVYTIEVSALGLHETCTGKSRKEAEIKCARKLLTALGKR